MTRREESNRFRDSLEVHTFRCLLRDGPRDREAEADLDGFASNEKSASPSSVSNTEEPRLRPVQKQEQREKRYVSKRKRGRLKEKAKC